MYQYDGKTKTWRVRYDYGHTSYYKKLIKEKIRIQKNLNSLEKQDKYSKKEWNNQQKQIGYITNKIYALQKKYSTPGKEVAIKTRRSKAVKTEWQAKFVNDHFKQAYAFEAEGDALPQPLKEILRGINEAPDRTHYIEELGYFYAAMGNFDVNVLKNLPYAQFLDQSDANVIWIKFLRIHENDIKNCAIDVSTDHEKVSLKGKTFIFTGSFVSYTTNEHHVNCLINIVKKQKIDGIIITGPWTKSIFLHKTVNSNEILDSVRKLVKLVPIYALRSNQEKIEFIPELKDLGITFVTTIEDEKNLFLNHKFSHTSTKDQFKKFKDFDTDKNLFVYTSYVGFETQLKKDKIVYLVGCGSSSVNTPRSRVWANSFDTQRFNSMKYDSTGGHILRFDKKSNVSVSTFHYNRILKGIMVDGQLYCPEIRKKQKCNFHILLSDIHVNYMNPIAFTGLLQYLEKYKKQIKSLSINGDFFDNAVLSHWDEHRIDEQIKNKKIMKSYLHEIALARNVLKEIVSKVNPQTKLIFKWGNHEINSIKKLLSKSLTHFLDTLLNLRLLLGLDDLGFEVIDGKKPFFIGDFAIMHGHEMSRPKARRIHGRKNISGHLHRCCIDNNGVCLPSLQESDSAEFMPYYRQNWANGWSVAHEFNNVIEKPQFILIHDKNKYYDFDTVVEIKKIIKIEIPKEISLTYKLD